MFLIPGEKNGVRKILSRMYAPRGQGDTPLHLPHYAQKNAVTAETELAEGLKLSLSATLIARSVSLRRIATKDHRDHKKRFQRAMIPFLESVLMVPGRRGVVKICRLQKSGFVNDK
jgi:hypothetical protein